MAEGTVVNRLIFEVQTKGVEEGERKVEKYGASLDKLDASQAKAAASSDKASAAQERAAAARARMEASAARLERQMQAEARMMAQAQAAIDGANGSLAGMSDAQLRAMRASDQATRAVNDNGAAVDRQGEAFKAAGKFIAEHPVLVLAGSVAAARALSGLSASAAIFLGGASAATAKFAAGSTEMGGAVAAGANVAARGLGLASTAAAATATGLGTYAEKVSGLTTATGLLGRGLTLLPPLFGPIALGFAVFETASASIRKAYSDLERIIALGQSAEKLDVSAPFLKSFTGLGAKIRVETDQMESALGRASTFLRDEYEQTNRLRKMLTDLEAGGYTGGAPLKAAEQLDLAGNTEGRIRAALSAMRELEDMGHKLAAINIAESVFGPEIAERLRQGRTTVSQIVADLDEASRKQVIQQEDVSRALDLSRRIEDTKRGISDALAVTFDFSGAAVRLNEAWLAVLETVKTVLDTINAGIEGAGKLITGVTAGLNKMLQDFGNLPIWSRINEYLDKMGLMDKGWRERGVGAAAPLELKVEPAIGSRTFPEMQGPKLPDPSKMREQQQAAQEAVSAYDLLIKRTEDRIKELDQETQAVGGTRDAVIKLKLAHELERAALKDGTTVTKEMREEWDRLGTRLADSTNRLEDSRRALENTREAQRELAGDFATFADDVVLGGKKIGDAFSSLSKSFSSSTLKALLTGEGPLAGLYGTAPTERGQVGGILGGKVDFAGLIPREIKQAISEGTQAGTESFWGPLFRQKKDAKGADMGFMSSPIGSAIGAAAAGAAVGYASGGDNDEAEMEKAA